MAKQSFEVAHRVVDLLNLLIHKKFQRSYEIVSPNMHIRKAAIEIDMKKVFYAKQILCAAKQLDYAKVCNKNG